MKNTEIDLRPGDVVLLDYPGVKQTKRRPAVVLSSHLYHQHRPDVIAGLITSQVDVATLTYRLCFAGLGTSSANTALGLSFVLRYPPALGDKTKGWKTFGS